MRPGVVVALGDARADRLAGVLQHVGQRLRDQASVALQIDRFLGHAGLERDLRMRHALQEHGLLDAAPAHSRAA